MKRAEKALASVDGLEEARVSLAQNSAFFISHDEVGLSHALTALKSAGYPVAEEQVTFRVQGMNCGSCVGRLQAGLQDLAGVTDVRANLASQSVTVRFHKGVVTPPALRRASGDIGYPVEAAFHPERQDAGQVAEIKVALKRFVLAALLTFPVFLLEMGGHVFPSLHHWIHRTIGLSNFWMLQAIVISLVLLIPGRSLIIGGIRALLRRAPDMNSLVTLGAGAAWLFSMVATFLPALLPAGTQAVYFEAAGVIVTLILVGRWLEARAKGQAGAAINALLTLQTPTARVVRADEEVETPIEDLVPGDLINIRPGEQIALDAVVVEGQSPVDEAMLTGEARPLLKKVGDPVTGGTLNGTGALTVRVTRTGEDTTLSRIVQMVQNAQSAKLPLERLIDKITMWFVPAIIAVACVAFLFWAFFGPQPVFAHALVAAVSVLIIACPCAMGLATPMSIMVGIGRAAQLGVFFRRGDALQQLMRCDVVAFDKTGTLTEGKPSVTKVKYANSWDESALLPLLASAERSSEHPLASAIVDFANQQECPFLEVTDFEAIPGKGISATVTDKAVVIGSEAFMLDRKINIGSFQEVARNFAKQAQSIVFVAIDQELAAVLSIADPIKENAKHVIQSLRQSGVRTAMISGDRNETADAVAAQLGIDTVIAGVLPDGKVAALDQLRSAGVQIAFVGDGINDAPALAHADVGIAMGSGTDVAIESADVVLMSGDPVGVVNALTLSRATMRNIKQNLGWAFGYNILLIPIAAGTLYPVFGLLLQPGLAALAMAFSSVSVIANALRLRSVAKSRAQSQQ